MILNSYVQQYERMIRFLNRLENQNRDQQDYIDDLWSFYQNCYHLKDWIINDEQLSLDRDTVEKAVNDSVALSTIADLANRSKHLKLTRHIRKGADMTEVGVAIKPPLARLNQHDNSEPCETEYEFIIETTNGGVFDGIKLATDGVNEWDKVFKTLGIKKP